MGQCKKDNSIANTLELDLSCTNWTAFEYFTFSYISPYLLEIAHGWVIIFLKIPWIHLDAITYPCSRSNIVHTRSHKVPWIHLDAITYPCSRSHIGHTKSHKVPWILLDAITYPCSRSHIGHTRYHKVPWILLYAITYPCSRSHIGHARSHKIPWIQLDAITYACSRSHVWHTGSHISCICQCMFSFINIPLCLTSEMNWSSGLWPNLLQHPW